MLYLEQVILYTAAMLLIYVLFLRNRPLFGFARFYLMLSAILPLVIPLVHLPSFVQQRVQAIPALQVTLPEVAIKAAGITQDIGSISMLWLIYGLMAMLFILWQIWGVYRLWHAVRIPGKQKGDRYTLITSSGYGPGSFGRYIFFPNDEVNKVILAHEQAHIALYHTLDIIFLNLLQAIVWPNVFLIWIKKEIRQVHEFQADAYVNADNEDYIELLLCSAFNVSSIPIMHSFIIHPIKRRIMMLQKNGRASLLKATLLVSACLGLVVMAGLTVQSCSKKSFNAASPPGGADDKNNYPDKDGVYKRATVMPQANFDLGSFLSANVKYPDDARHKGIEGKVVIKFIVGKNGDVLNPVVIKSPDSMLSAEALRVVSIMPKWTPGENEGERVPVSFYLPILFRLDNNDNTKEMSSPKSK